MPLPSLGDLPDPELKPVSLMSSALQVDSVPLSHERSLENPYDSGNIDWKYLTWELIDRWQASEIPVQLIMETSSWTYKACILCILCSHIQQGNICLPWNDMQRSDQTGVL